MVHIKCMLYVHTIEQKGEWFMIKDIHSEIIPTLYTIHTYLPEWIPFLQYMNVFIEQHMDIYTIKLQCKSNVYEITCYEDKRIITLPRWDTLTYIDIIRVISSMFHMPVKIIPYVNDASYVLECTRSMYYKNNEIHLF
jgi:hypothetical protein